jgi:hypothetical protein
MSKKFFKEKIKDTETFERAYLSAIYYRIKQDSFCNFIEIDFYRQNKEQLRREVELIFDKPDTYKPDIAFSFYLPKSDMF